MLEKKTYSMRFTEIELKSLEKKAFEESLKQDKRVPVAAIIKDALRAHYPDIEWEKEL